MEPVFCGENVGAVVRNAGPFLHGEKPVFRNLSSAEKLGQGDLPDWKGEFWMVFIAKQDQVLDQSVGEFS